MTHGMKVWLPFLLFITGVFFPTGLFAAEYTSADCEFTTVNNLVNGSMSRVTNGDTVKIAMGSCTWGTGNLQRLAISKAIHLRGEFDCVTDNDGNASDCTTVIADNRTDNNGLITWT